MPQKLTDTDSGTEKVFLELIRKTDPRRRFALADALTGAVRDLSRRAIARANPSLPDSELDILFVEYHYGTDLANRLRKYLKV